MVSDAQSTRTAHMARWNARETENPVRNVQLHKRNESRNGATDTVTGLVFEQRPRSPTQSPLTTISPSEKMIFLSDSSL